MSRRYNLRCLAHRRRQHFRWTAALSFKHRQSLNSCCTAHLEWRHRAVRRTTLAWRSRRWATGNSIIRGASVRWWHMPVSITPSGGSARCRGTHWSVLDASVKGRRHPSVSTRIVCKGQKQRSRNLHGSTTTRHTHKDSKGCYRVGRDQEIERGRTAAEVAQQRRVMLISPESRRGRTNSMSQWLRKVSSLGTSLCFFFKFKSVQ